MIRVEDESHAGGVMRLIRLDRPEKANALTADMLEALAEAVETAGAAQALILTGTGKVFSAGADLEAAAAGLATSPLWERLSGAIAAFPGLSIAALNGTLAGGACGMALACDLRLSMAEAKVFYPVMRLGYLPQPSDPARLVALVGPARARMILMAGAKIPADEALQWGLIDRIIPAEALLDAARALCADVLAADAGHVAAIKRMTESPRVLQPGRAAT
ncbi:enoyl-CoA hydratase/isomerase family protein [Xinfangfangia sp. CPCC 101601]|uniref:Enoyl-CoA hydratase/isomerase family protein n=1 Tax=Pseudogemmobacter lacusdianii TaxID=3069608 RepID=A0ABU0VXN4_9RHOB|nr:enoyl-CoA hydratase/isomerase family protein [Xinfangfangia sp. CPCC 101601]MDQ2066383.1 enoyl-CoA hydratase/isomerase family protein [Xinfangfangia sp. CPCC 101601]